MKNLSLRTRLIIGTIVLLTLGLVLADIAGVVLFRYFQLQQVDDQLQAPFSATAPEQLRSWLSQACASSNTVELAPLPTNFTVLALDAEGRVTCRVPEPLADGVPMDLTPQQLADAADTGTILTLVQTPVKISAWRAKIVRFDDGYAVLAMSLADADASVSRLGRITLSVGAIILAIAAGAVVAVVRIALRPLTRIEATAGQIAAGDLSQRIDVGSTRTEIGRLASSLNSMLAQIEAAFAERDQTEDRLRRFVADASHELRTPLATIRGHAELVRQGVAHTPEEVTRVAGRIESETIRMTSLVEDLLLLARLDTTRVLEQRPIDLLTLAVDAVNDTRVREPERSISIANPTEPPWREAPPIVLGDDARLQQVLTNLLSNAVKHTPTGTPVEVEVGVQGDRVRLSIIDHGPGLRVGNEERVFERFFREDAGRGRGQGGGVGLGLSIAWTLVEKHGGALRYVPTPGGGSTFEIRLPLSEL
jgi:two-component system OmpR family sensor kinase